MKIVIIMPVYEDWDAAIELSRKIDLLFRQEKSLRVSLLLIDDGSNRSTYPDELSGFEAIEQISVLALRRNLGHQRAIAVGLAHIQQHWSGQMLLGGDGCRRRGPSAGRHSQTAGRNAQRRASHGRICGARKAPGELDVSHRMYIKLLFPVCTSFSPAATFALAISAFFPGTHLEQPGRLPRTLEQLFGYIFQSPASPTFASAVIAARGITGQSRMNFVRGLVVHGLSALFANQEVVGTRLLLMTIVITVALFLLIGAVVGGKMLSGFLA